MKYCIIIFVLATLTLLTAQHNQIEKREYSATLVVGAPPKIDGLLNDVVWASGEWESNFTQIDPIEGRPASEITRFKIIYDKNNIYIGIMSYDSQPNLISKRVSRRDNTYNSDVIFVGIDSYFDRRTAFYFGLNVSGVRSDFIMFEDGDSHDENWDPVWVGKTTINDSGWVAEYRIPFSQLRFSEATEQIWGFQITRSIHRKQERNSWQFIPKDASGVVSNFGILKGIMKIDSPSRIELLPYGVGSLNTYEAEDGNPFQTGRDFEINAGLDGKIGITSNINFDFTVNPDFGQVEADPSDVNLSAFETFFEEKRPFFIEGGNIFNFPIFTGDDEGEESIFYSRRIGREPHYEPNEDDGYPSDYIDMPDQTRILGAAKLSGKTSNGWSIGMLDAVTSKEYAQVRHNDTNYEVTAEPLTNYMVSRLQKDFDAGNTSLGGIFTATNRKIENQHLDYINKSAYSGGLDFRHQWNNKSYFIQGKIFSSHIFGDPNALTRLQESSARYFQRPDNDYVNYDTSRTSLTGHGGSFDFGKTGNSPWDFGIGGTWRSPELELNDLGYMRNTDFSIGYAWLGYNQRNPIGIFRRYNLQLSGWQGWNFGGDCIELGSYFGFRVEFLNYWSMRVSLNRNGTTYSSHLLRGGPLARSEGDWNLSFGIGSDERKDLEFDFRYSRNISDDGISKSKRYRVSLFYKMNPKINFMLRPSAVYRIENLQYIDAIELEHNHRYVFGKIDQKTYGLVFRLDYSPTPDISFQYYGQPFFSSGYYDEFKHINNPRGVKSDRYYTYTSDEISYDIQSDTYLVDEGSNGQAVYGFENPDYNVMEFLSNLVFRWQYRPGSTIYLVWSQFRNQENQFIGSDLGGSFNNLFQTHPENVFLIKLNYWLSL